MNTNHENVAGDGRLARFEKNRYFHGKLMTARDMLAEQDYHAGRLNTLNRLVAGYGLVCGLDATVEERDEALRVTVRRGVALDSRGRPIVVKSDTRKELPLPRGNEIYLSLTYDECSKESVPVPGSENACEEECCYNRILEIFEVTYEEDEPERYKTIPEITFPVEEELPIPEEEPTLGTGLGTIARSYWDNADRSECEPAEDPSVFLGAFTRDGGNWTRTTETDNRPLVYDNEMLYAAIARHITFDNPHDVTSEQTGALVSVEDVENPGGNIDLDSSDGTLTISGDDEANRVDLDVSETVLDRLSMLERYVLETSLWCECTFDELDEQFGLPTAGEIAKRMRDALDAEAYANDEEYRSLFTGDGGLLELLTDLDEELAPREDIFGTTRFADVLEALEEVLDEGDADAFEVAVAANRVCWAAECLHGVPAEPQPAGPLRCVDFDGFLPDWLAEQRPDDLRIGSRKFPLAYRGCRFGEGRDDEPSFVEYGHPAGLVKLKFPQDGLEIVVPTTSSVAVEIANAPLEMGSEPVILLGRSGGEVVAKQTADLDARGGTTTTLRVQGPAIDSVELQTEAPTTALLEICIGPTAPGGSERPAETTIDTNTFDEEGNPKLEVEAAEDQVITGRSHLDPEERLFIQAKSRGDGRFPTRKVAPTTVDENFDYAATFDFSDVSPGTPFQIHVTHQRRELARLDNAEVV